MTPDAVGSSSLLDSADKDQSETKQIMDEVLIETKKTEEEQVSEKNEYLTNLQQD
ncbi:hypothetical protein V5G20_11180 [Brevibacillus borstelensis]|uniref:hypothetical protein n=1 Tax=Brevibacillus borstelensis TaxID=45462 RepID=UPI00039A5604|nr:hypothetical protein [Brevibacillus borstelensis]